MRSPKLIFLLILCIQIIGCTTVETAQNVVPAQNQSFEQPFSKVYSRSLSTLMELQWQLSHANKEEGLIQARTPMTLWTTGDLVTVHVFEESQNTTRVEVSSASAQQFDWGKNKENIVKFYSRLTEKLKAE